MPPAEISTARVAAELERVNRPSFRANAARLAAKLRACGGLERALRVIESVTTAHVPSGLASLAEVTSEDPGQHIVARLAT
jgi:predicted N-acetyltransferase YhbS